MADQDNGVAVVPGAGDGDSHDLLSVLSTSDRNYLVRNNGDQVKIDDLKGKKVALYFSASRCGPCLKFTPTLVDVYNELSPKGDFEVVIVSDDEDDKAFDNYFSKLPWLAIPFSDYETHDCLDDVFRVSGIPHLLILDEDGKVLTSDGVEMIRKYGVAVSSLKGKKVGLYFSASWCGPCQRFTPNLVDVYKELSGATDFEIVFLSGDEDEESFSGYFSKMPWLAVPFSDSETRESLDGLFKVRGIPYLVFLDENGKVVTNSGVEIIREYGAEAYPFTPEHINELKAQEEAARKNQSLRSLLVSRTRDFVISSDGKKVLVSELEGKTIGLYFSLSSYKKSLDFTPTLVDIYENLKTKGENFEIVMIPLDDEEESFSKGFDGVPWFSLPFKDKSCEKLVRYFELSTLPTLVIIGADGKTLHSNVADAIDEHGILAYPFTPEKFAELEELEKAKREAQTLESILVSGDRNYVIGKDGAKIPVSDLTGKLVLLYFSAHWCPPCRAFTPKLVEAYHKIKAKDSAFEVIFISSDMDEDSFGEYYSSMPWLALPYGDKRKESLGRVFKVGGIPMLVALGPTGKTITTEARDLVMLHGAEAYPFTEERLQEIEAQYAEMTKGWPDKLQHALHEHELTLTRSRVYTCDACDEAGQVWSFSCEDCDFDLHPSCALKEEKKTEEEGGEGSVKVEGEQKEGWVCDGDVCHKAP